ncbi:MAG: hypothetical protein LBC56_06650 [Oscillospiraceae bacterium]|jgi:alginate O-acetyltransferase complex protein AlgI|nr:hypothetical protein [Oscillospiraceae bacterium]
MKPLTFLFFPDLFFTYLLLIIPLVVIIYYIAPDRLKNALLFGTSMAMCGFGGPLAIILMSLPICFDYIAARLMEHIEKRGQRLRLLGASFALNAGLIFVCKFLTDDFRLAGLCFYTLQSFAYLRGVYLKKYPAQKDFINYGMYISFFFLKPAGPILNYENALPQFTGRKIDSAKILYGLRKLASGLCKKILLADNAYALQSELLQQGIGGTSALGMWLSVFALAFWLFFSLSGYADMATGLGALFGFEIEENFNKPFTAQSVEDFALRWNISFTKFIKENIYAPLAAKFKNSRLEIFIIPALTALCGLWYNWGLKFALTGFLAGLALLGEKRIWGGLVRRLPAALRHVYALTLMICGWILLSCENPGDIPVYIRALFGGGSAGWINDRSLSYLFSYAGFLLLYFLFSSNFIDRFVKLAKIKNSRISAALLTVVYAAAFVLCFAYKLRMPAFDFPAGW